MVDPVVHPRAGNSDPRRAGEDMPVTPTPAAAPETRAYPTCDMTPERFQDRFEFFTNQPQQVSGVWMLYDAIRALPGGTDVLREEAPWALKFSEKPAGPQPLAPRGSEEAGMAGPKIKAPVKENDSYLLVNDKYEFMEAYDAYGKFLWKIPALARGQGSDYDWKTNSSDTPPGLYRVGQIYRDYEQYGANPAYNGTLQSYGWYSLDLVELENQEAANGRAGIMIHGGGSGCGWPGAWAPKQTLYPTLGCVRVHNIELRDRIVPLCDKGDVYVGVFQEIR